MGVLMTFNIWPVSSTVLFFPVHQGMGSTTLLTMYYMCGQFRQNLQYG